MKTVSVEIPEQIVLSLKIPEPELQEQLKVELAVRLYQKRILGFGKARELAGLTKWQFLEKLAKEQIPLNYDVEELERDLETVRRYRESTE
jgi:predicted HTH domain antitoxin